MCGEVIQELVGTFLCLFRGVGLVAGDGAEGDEDGVVDSPSVVEACAHDLLDASFAFGV